MYVHIIWLRLLILDKGVGIKRAYAAVRQKPDPNDTITFLKNKHHLTVPGNYQCSFQLAMSTILAHLVFDPSQLTQVPLYEVESNQVYATFIHMDGIQLLDFTKGNIDPGNLDQLADQFSLDKPSIVTYAIKLSKLHVLAVNNDEHQPQENNRENDQDVAPNTTFDKKTPMIELMAALSIVYHLKFWEVHIIKKCKIIWSLVCWQ